VSLWELARFERNTAVMVPGDTIPEVFLHAVRMRSDRVWMRQKKLGVWKEWTWKDAAAASREVAMGLADLGFQPGDCAAILANTVLEWMLADLGILFAGGVSNGIYPTDSPEQVDYLSNDSKTSVIFAENDEQLDKVLTVRDRIPSLKWIVVFDMEGLQGLNDPQIISLQKPKAR
jgi:long-chain acyl-CoA synthetase